MRESGVAPGGLILVGVVIVVLVVVLIVRLWSR
jgi:hypothetical protein